VTRIMRHGKDFRVWAPKVALFVYAALLTL